MTSLVDEIQAIIPLCPASCKEKQTKGWDDSSCAGMPKNVESAAGAQMSRRHRLWMEATGRAVTGFEDGQKTDAM